LLEDVPVPARKLGPLLRSTRLQRGVSLTLLAKRAGVSPSHLSRLETSEYLAVSEKFLRRLAQLLDLPADDVITSAGRIPKDVETYLATTPGALARVRRRMGAS
jgi:transcriptional regulator with XRE-family HTH domain